MTSFLKIRSTSDGSTTVENTQLGETYHSVHGAVTESRHVFLWNGLEWFEKNRSARPIKIFEVGLGTGLNAALATQWSVQTNVPIRYTSIEKYPLEEHLVESLVFPGLDRQWLDKIHRASWNEQLDVHPMVSFKKISADLLEFDPEPGSADLIFFDAFAPSRQPEMWDMSVIEKITTLMSREGVLVSYCAQGQFKRNLRSCGLEVAALPGPPGKREMVRAIRPSIPA
ncbi:MAG: tRNA (5-methylaminomethyl-2-thiouridine)(34)-methyltransferase MnmD [Bacteroidetes bacterium]|nr:tRNA (5-methylaminomethyl-2-thiouridine)(34)-methyltransferase MnmD [Bacteroidota bacterium]